MYHFASAQPSALPDLCFAPSEIGLYHEQLNFEHIQHFILLPCSSRSYYILADSQSQLIILQPMRCINALNFTASASTSCSCWPTCHSPRHAVNTAREHRRQPARQLRGCCSTTTCSPLWSFFSFLKLTSAVQLISKTKREWLMNLDLSTIVDGTFSFTSYINLLGC